MFPTLSASVNVIASPCGTVLANNWICIFVGLIPSWLLLSSHTLLAVIFNLTCAIVFVKLYPSFDVVYPATVFSLTVYSYLCPFAVL